MSESIASKPKKRRSPRACDYCHQRSIRCRPSNNGADCQNCVAFDQPCTWDRPRKRRGAPSRSERPVPTPTPLESGESTTSPAAVATTTARRSHTSSGDHPQQSRPRAQSKQPPSCHNEGPDTIDIAWEAPQVAGHATVVDLVELYFEIVYPIFPLFHQPSFVRKISRAEYTSNRSLFAVTMAVCALVSARVRDGAVFNPRWDVRGLQKTKPQIYYIQAIQQAREIPNISDINAPRTYAILALAAIQEGQTRDMQEHLGHYHTILAMEGSHDEDSWPAGLGVIETEERRRLFWSVYTLDVFTSIVWGGVIRSREAQSNVSYPTEVDDDMFDDTGFPGVLPSLGATSISQGQAVPGTHGTSWIAGRNFVTDLYRVIERLLMQFPSRPRAQREILGGDSFRRQTSLSQSSVRDSMMQMYVDLPQCLKEVNPVTCKPRLDRFGFQAADIIATLQLLRMVLLSSTGGSIADRCQLMHEVVTAFISIPTAYHHAISVPLLFHLGVIGQLLSTTLEQPLGENDYSCIREVLLSMVQLLSTLEGLHASKGASERLRHQVARIDEYMMSQRQNAGSQLDATELDYADARRAVRGHNVLRARLRHIR